MSPRLTNMPCSDQACGDGPARRPWEAPCSGRGRSMRNCIGAGVVVAMASALAVIVGGGGGPPAVASENLLNGPSPAVGLHAYLQHPELAPAELRSRFKEARHTAMRLRRATALGGRSRSGIQPRYGRPAAE